MATSSSTVATPVSTSSAAAASSTSPSFTFQTVAEMFTCGETIVRWTYTGASSPLTLNITNVNVSQQAPLSTAAASSTSQAASAVSTTAQAKRQFNGYGGSYLPPINTIIIAGIDPTSNNYTWSSVDVPQGWYQLNANVQNTVQTTSSPFFVLNGTNTNCVVQFATTPANSSSTSHLPVATNSNSSPSTHSKSSNTGAIVGGVVGGLAFLAAAILALLYWQRRRRSSYPRQLDEGGGGRRWSDSFKKLRPSNNTRSSTQKTLPGPEAEQTIVGSDEELSTVEHEKAIAASQPPPQLPPHQPTRSLSLRDSTQTTSNIQPTRSASLRNSTQTTGSYGRAGESPGIRSSISAYPGEAIPMVRTNSAGGTGTVSHLRRKPAPRYEGAAEAQAQGDGRSSSQTTLDFVPGTSFSTKGSPDSNHVLQHKGTPDSDHLLQHKSSFGAVRPMHVMITDPPARTT